MGYRLNRRDEPVFMAMPKPMLTEFGIHCRLESCDTQFSLCIMMEEPKIVFGKKSYIEKGAMEKFACGAGATILI